ncbi:hypothetical protein JW758_05925 [Candidatus Peregrinibacteria bacterium]|nr:hypothetical protein [Candidatus Peregrinibacteria bacterium]
MKTSMQKLFKVMLLISFVMLVFSVPVTFAQSSAPSVLPSDDFDIGGYGDACTGLAQRIRTGDITLEQIPCFIKYFSQTLIAIAGSLSVIFVMIGGYKYVVGSDEQKDVAKKTITYALIGLAVSLSAWILVDLVLQFATE